MYHNIQGDFQISSIQKQPPRGVPTKSCSKNMQQIYRRTPTPKCYFNSKFIEITLRHGYSPVNFLHIFRTPFLKNTSGRLLLGISYMLVVNIKSVGVIQPSNDTLVQFSVRFSKFSLMMLIFILKDSYWQYFK